MLALSLNLAHFFASIIAIFVGRGSKLVEGCDSVENKWQFQGKPVIGNSVLTVLFLIEFYDLQTTFLIGSHQNILDHRTISKDI